MRIQERDQEEWNVALPRDPAVRRQIDRRDKITITICRVGDEELSRIHGIVYIPATGIPVNDLQLTREMTYKMTLQNPKPSEDAALKNFSFDWTDPTSTKSKMEAIELRTINFPRKTPSTGQNQISLSARRSATCGTYHRNLWFGDQLKSHQ